MLFAIIVIVGLSAFFYLIIRSIPKVTNHVTATFSGLIPNLERVFGQLSPATFNTLTKEQKVMAVGEFIIQIVSLSIAAILIYSLF
jgi:hypothetical protein